MCCFKFRLWNCLSYSQNSETAGLHKAIINIKRSRRQAVTALNIIVIANYPFEKHYILASLVKGRWIDGKAQVLILLLSACDMPIIFMLQTFCRQDGGIASPPPFAPHQPFQNRTITLAFRSAIVCVCLYGFAFKLSHLAFRRASVCVCLVGFASLQSLWAHTFKASLPCLPLPLHRTYLSPRPL